MVMTEDNRDQWKTARQWAAEGRIVCKEVACIADGNEREDSSYDHRKKYFHVVQTKKPSKSEVAEALAAYRHYMEARAHMKELRGPESKAPSGYGPVAFGDG